MRLVTAVPFAVAAVLCGGCSGIPAGPGLKSAAQMNDERKAEMLNKIGEKRHFGGASYASVCDDRQTTRCHNPSTGHATIESVPDFATNERPVFQVKLNNGKAAYILAHEWSTMRTDAAVLDQANATAAEKRAAAEAKAACDRRGGVSIGMTAAQVRGSCWGNPSRINKTVTQRGIHEQWVYGLGTYVYVTDGVVTSIQHTSR